MYVEDGTNFVLSEESIALWAQNTKAYVKAVKRRCGLTYGRSHVRELEAQDMPALRLAGGHDGAHLPRVWGAAALSGRRSPSLVERKPVGRLGSVRPGASDPRDGRRRGGARRSPAIAGSAPSQTDIERSLGRSDRVVVPLMVVALVLTIAVGMWFTGRAQQPRTQDAVGAGYFPDVPSPTSAVVPSAAPTDAGLVGQPGVGERCSPSGTCRCR